MTESGPIPVREGELVAGKYRVGPVIGVGGMGVIVAARHEQLDQPVAIKFVRGEALGGNDEAVQRFLREARAAARLKSEHVAKVLDVGTLESGVPYMVMELLEGSDLAHTIADRGPLAVEVAADWIAQACEALAEAHAAGIVHRDLKPQNLFLARTVGGAAKVKVLDFGVSKASGGMTSGPGALTRTSAMLGSPLYMAPEQMRSSRDVDARTDIWALGVVLFELLTQRWPFHAEALPELCLKVVSDPPQSLHELRPELPMEVVRVVERCLEKDPQDRYANAAELSSALEPLLPAASRAVVERARLAIARPPEGATPARSRKMNLPPVPTQAAPVPSRMARTPAAWGSGRGASRAMAGPRGAFLWSAVAVLVIAGVVGGIALFRRGTPDPPAQAAAEPSRETATAPTPPPPLPAKESPVVLAPLPTDAPKATTTTDTPSVQVKVPRAIQSALPQTGNPAVPPPPLRQPAAAAKSSRRDDDIPALR